LEPAKASRQSHSSGTKAVRPRQTDAAASRPHPDAAIVPRAPDDSDRSIRRAEDINAELVERRLKMGNGAFMSVLFHEPDHDSAMILLEPNCRIREVNDDDRDILYIVVEAEYQQLEFRVSRPRGKPKSVLVPTTVSTGAELLVHAGQEYVIINRSRSKSARFMTIVPRPGT